MALTTGENVYTKLGLVPVINAGGNTTNWGGSTPSPLVRKAMHEAELGFVEMGDLLDKSGQFIADLLDVESAYVTSGCFSALVLSTAACIVGEDGDKRALLPDTSGMKNEILLQTRHHYGYERSYGVPGGKLIEVGDSEGTSRAQLEKAIGPNTAAVAYLVKAEPDDHVVSLEDTVDIAHSKEVPVIADAASQIYPLDYFRRNAQSADLVCFGGKYMNAPHSTGFVCGKEELVRAVQSLGFIPMHEGDGRPFGRGMKIDRQEIIGLVAAVEAWVTMDHEERLLSYGSKFSVIERKLQTVSAVRQTKVVPNNDYWSLGLQITLDIDALGKSARDVLDELDSGVPRIRMRAAGDDILTVNPHTLRDGEEVILAERLRSVLVG